MNEYRKMYCNHLHTQHGIMKVSGPTEAGKKSADSFRHVYIDVTEIAFTTQAFLFDLPDGFSKKNDAKGRTPLRDSGTLIGYIVTDSITADFCGLLHYPISTTELREYKKKTGWTEL